MIPAKAGKRFQILPGDQLVVPGDKSQGPAIVKSEHFPATADLIRNATTL